VSTKVRRVGCYSEEEWQAYQAGILGDSEQMKMEEHLLGCDDCLQLYLGLLSERMKNMPKPDGMLAQKVLDLCQPEKNQAKAKTSGREIYRNKEKGTRNSRLNLFVAYCAAASIAMFLWTGGYFDRLAGLMTREADYLQTSALEYRINPGKNLIQSGWTQKITEEKHSFLILNLILRKE
jgi:hypothetical protein